jgi:LPS-assembly protein
VDSGIVLERNFTLGGQALRQTLEPRLFYLYVPERDQNELPRFDTTSASFSFSSLYDVNRFTGPDRIGDANQLTTGLTSRVLDGGNGREYLSVSAGQIFYFADRQVTLRGTAPETRPRSDIITELNLSLPAGLSVDADYQFNPDESGNDDLRTRFQWKGSRTQVVNLDYRVRRSDGERSREEAEFSFATPVLDRWQVVGGWSQDLLNDRVQERFAGLQYDSCCYALRAVYRSYLVDRGDAEAALTDQAMLQLELKGLGGVGDKIIEFLNDAVRGYNPPQY